MTLPPILTDLAALQRNRDRARKRPDHLAAMYLHKAVVADVQERLLEVNKSFTSPAVVTDFPQIWAQAYPQARILPVDEVLGLSIGAHDLVIHAMALHWANDPLGQIVQCRRALSPDGLFLGILLGGRTLSELRTSLAEAEALLTGGLSPRVLPMAEIRDLGSLLQRAGLALPVADSFAWTARFRSFSALVSDLRAMGETNALASRLRRPTGRAVFREAERIYAAMAGTDAGGIAATFEMIFLTGWAPHASQQIPLRPGTANQRLADALKVPERPLPNSG